MKTKRCWTQTVCKLANAQRVFDSSPQNCIVFDYIRQCTSWLVHIVRQIQAQTSISIFSNSFISWSSTWIIQWRTMFTGRQFMIYTTTSLLLFLLWSQQGMFTVSLYAELPWLYSERRCLRVDSSWFLQRHHFCYSCYGLSTVCSQINYNYVDLPCKLMVYVNGKGAFIWSEIISDYRSIAW